MGRIAFRFSLAKPCARSPPGSAPRIATMDPMDALISPTRSLQRASQAVRCLPFRRAFYATLAHGSLDAEALADEAAAALRFTPLSPQRAEDHLLWLIRLGVLRREVDGQGLTRRVRLTPMGRHLLQQLPEEVLRAGPLERLQGFWRRHRPRLL